MKVETTPLPDYLVDVVARETFERERVDAASWDALDDVKREGYREIARTILQARAAQTDIKR